MTASAQPPLALLIDGENVSHQIAPALLLAAMVVGDPIVRRVYGRTATPAMVAWQACSGDHALILPGPTGAEARKNAADIAMVIGAMHLLHTTPIRHFCLVSSDSDFSDLALYLREAGCTVVGVGRESSSAALRNAHHQFNTVEELMLPTNTKAGPLQKPGRRAVDTIVPLIEQAICDAPDPRVPVSLSFVGARLRTYLPDFNPGKYGHTKLSSLIRSTQLYHFSVLNGMMYITPKPAAGGMHH